MNQAHTVDKLSAASLATVEQEAQRKIKQRYWLVISLRVAILILTLGGWELAARLQWIDPFFFSQPSLIVIQIYDWIVEGTSQGPLWTQVLVTLEDRKSVV